MNRAPGIPGLQAGEDVNYANFLVVHRAHLQSMPLEWQARFVDLLEDLGAAFPDIDDLAFEVTTVRDAYVGELTGDEMLLAGITRGDADDDEDADAAYYDKTGRELRPGWDHVGVPVPDPVPHYRHAYLAPDEAAIARSRELRRNA